MPTDQAHIIAFLVTLGAIATLGVVAFIVILRTTPKRKARAIQPSFDFTERPKTPAPVKIQTPPMAGI